MRTHQQTNAPKTAIGYVRVSTQEQATDGVSLDAQRDRLKAYCKLNAIKLIDIKADEGYSGSTLDRPALQAALQMVRLFSDDRNHLLSLSGMVNTHSAAGRMVRWIQLS